MTLLRSSFAAISIAFTAVFFATACSGITIRSASMVLTDFPSQEEVQGMAAGPAPMVNLEEIVEFLHIEQWSLHEPLPTRIGDIRHSPQNNWEEDVANVAAGAEHAQASEAMQCTARQSAHFYTEHHELPPGPVLRFIAARCGWVGDAPHVEIRHTNQTSHGALWQQLRGDVLSWLEDQADVGPTDMGLWIGDIDEYTLISTVVAHRPVAITSRSMQTDGDFIIEGQVLDSRRFDGVSALVTEGDFDFAYCRSDEAVRFPNFRITCPVGPRDRLATFELILHLAGQDWFQPGTIGQVWSGAPDHAYRAPRWRRAWAHHVAGEDHSDEELEPEPLLTGVAVTGDALEERIVSLTNIVREIADREPLTLSTPQSRTNAALAPHLLEALREDDLRARDRISRAILAGWDISDQVLSGRLQTGTVADGDGRDAVDLILERPSGRQVLMGELTAHVAFGTVQEGDHSWMVISGYRRVPDLSAEEMVATATDTINAAREAAGVGPLVDAEQYQQAATLLSRGILQGSHDPVSASDRIMRAMARNLQTSVRSWTILTDDLERIQLPDEVVTTPGLRAAVLAAPWQDEKEPWSLFRVIIIFPEGDMDTRGLQVHTVPLGDGSRPGTSG